MCYRYVNHTCVHRNSICQFIEIRSTVIVSSQPRRMLYARAHQRNECGNDFPLFRAVNAIISSISKLYFGLWKKKEEKWATSNNQFSIKLSRISYGLIRSINFICSARKLFGSLPPLRLYSLRVV